MRYQFLAGAAVCSLLLGAAPTTANAATASASRLVVATPSVVSLGWPGIVVIARLNLGRERMNEGWWRNNGYRPVTVYVVDGRYYNSWNNHFRGRDVRRVIVYERNGRLYRDWDDDRRSDGYRGNGRYGGDDRYGRDDRNDRDDRYGRGNDDRYGRGNDDRYGRGYDDRYGRGNDDHYGRGNDDRNGRNDDGRDQGGRDRSYDHR